ncbi:Flp family type IVb pilin [Vibrio sp. RC27]
MVISSFVKIACAFNHHKQRGVTAIEYAVIGVGISLIVVTVFSTDGQLQSAFSGAITEISSNITSAGDNG